MSSWAPYGIFYHLFSLLEDECHQLDIRVTEEDSSIEGGASYTHHLRAVEEYKVLKHNLDRCT